MYIWVILTAFIVSLHTYNLHYREDEGAVRLTPIAEAVAAKVTIQHKALLKYQEKNRSTIEDNVLIDSYREFSDDELIEYAPFSVTFDDRVHSALFCIDASVSDKSVLTRCDKTSGVEGYFVTYMQIPWRWLNRDLEATDTFEKYTANGHLITGITNVSGRSTTFGYNIPKRTELSDPEDVYVSDVEIRNIHGRSFLPEAIFKHHEFDKVCMQGVPCILYLSTAFKR